jgi:type IV secretory pathway VirB9-like protein
MRCPADGGKKYLFFTNSIDKKDAPAIKKSGKRGKYHKILRSAARIGRHVKKKMAR